MAVAFVKSLGTSFNKTAGATLAHTFTGATTAGNLIVARVVFDNAATASKPIVSSIGKMAGETNNWVLLGAARSTSTTLGAFSSGEMWCIQTTVAWTAAAYTTTLDLATSVMKAVLFQEFSGVTATPRSTAGTAYSTSTTAASAVTTGTTPVIGDLALGFIFGSNVAAAMAGDTDTTGGSWSAVAGFGSTGSGAATNNFGIGQYKVLTAASHQTLNNSAVMTAGNGSIVAILQAIPAPSITQAAYRFYDETGTESGSTALDAQDTAHTADLSVGTGYGLVRLRLQSTTAVAVQATDDFTLQWEKNARGVWTNVIPSTSLADGLDQTFADNYIQIFNTGNVVDTSKRGQSFLGNGQRLVRVGFYIQRFQSPTGNLTAELYAHTGTFGSTGLPTGSPLATSTTVLGIASVATTVGWYYFDFDRSFTLTNGTAYVVVLSASAGTGDTLNHHIRLWRDTTSPTHPGASMQWSSSTWAAQTSTDTIFALYTGPTVAPTTVLPYDAPSLTEGQATTNRLTGGTGTFVAGKVSEDGTVNDLGWAGNNYTELVFALQIDGATLTDGDMLRFRVVRNGSTAGMTYTAVPTVNVVLPVIITQEGFRWRNDDGTEAAATWKAAQDANASLGVGTSARLRVLLDNTGGDAAPTAYTLYYKKSTDSTWLPIPVGAGGGSPVYVAPSPNIAAGGQATTALLTPPSGKTTAKFSIGRMWDDENGTDLIDIGAYRDEVLADSPWVYCELETFGATTPDSSGNGRTVTVRNGSYVGLATGMVGNGFEAIFHDSSSFIVQTSVSTNPPTTYSWEAWFRTSVAGQVCFIGTQTDPNLVDGNEEKVVYVTAAGNVELRGWNTGTGADRVATTAGVNCIDNIWHHVVATESPTNGKCIYIDGTLQGTGLASDNTGFTPCYLRFGGVYPGGAPSWASAGEQSYSVRYIDECAFYTTELSAVRVAAHYTAAT